jgi:hypothetical protein
MITLDKVVKTQVHKKFPFNTTCCSYLREMIEVLRVGLRPHCYSIHLIVETIQKKAKELLSILLAEPKEKSEQIRCTKTWFLLPPTLGWTTRARPLLIADKAWCVSLDLGFELRRAHHIIGR